MGCVRRERPPSRGGSASSNAPNTAVVGGEEGSRPRLEASSGGESVPLLILESAPRHASVHLVAVTESRRARRLHGARRGAAGESGGFHGVPGLVVSDQERRREYVPCSGRVASMANVNVRTLRGMHAGLGEMYVGDERFAAHFEKRGSGLAAYPAEAIQANVARRRTVRP